jgi:hypothetical protein
MRARKKQSLISSVYQQPTDWDAIIRLIDGHWSPLESNFEGLLRVFPLPRASGIDPSLLTTLSFAFRYRCRVSP